MQIFFDRLPLVTAVTTVLVVLTLIIQVSLAGAAVPKRLYYITGRKIVTLDQILSTVKGGSIILVGEHHTNTAHHAMQLAVIKTLHARGMKVAVGMEMFRKDSQPDLDAWTSGEKPKKAFEAVYYDNWNFDWDLYAPILEHARDNRLALVGLNISRTITGQVARKGFQSLTDDQRERLGPVVCRVDTVYLAFIKRAYGTHAHGQLDFTHFCEAQLVWDNIMAINALDFMAINPDHVLVIVTGNGHAWKGGIPTQIAARAQVPVTVILPEIAGVSEPGMIDGHDADYIFQLK